MRRFEYGGVPPHVQLKGKLEAMTLLFQKGQSTIAPGQIETIRLINTLLARLDHALVATGRQALVELLGHTDADGTDQENQPLSQARAGAALDALQTSALDALTFRARGVGKAPSLTADEAEKVRNRRVSLRVILPDETAPGGSRR